MMKKIVTVVSLVLFYCGTAQDVRSLLVPNNSMLINSSLAGAENHMKGMLQYQYQALKKGFEGSVFLTFEGQLQTFGYGIVMIQNQKLGGDEFGVSGQGAYRLSLGTTKLSLGVQLGMLYYTLGNDIEGIEADEAFNATSSTSMIGGLGAYWYKPDAFHLGASVTQLPLYSSNDLIYKPELAVYLHGDYAISTDGSLVIRPAVVTAYVAKEFLWEAYVYGDYRQFTAGLFYKGFGLTGLSLSANIYQGLNLIYSLGLSTSSALSDIVGLTHEIGISYQLNKVKKTVSEDSEWSK